MGLVVHMYRGPRKSLFGTFIALWFSLRLHGALPHTPSPAAFEPLGAFLGQTEHGRQHGSASP